VKAHFVFAIRLGRCFLPLVVGALYFLPSFAQTPATSQSIVLGASTDRCGSAKIDSKEYQSPECVTDRKLKESRARNELNASIVKSCKDSVDRANKHRESGSMLMKACGRAKKAGGSAACLATARKCGECAFGAGDDENFETDCGDFSEEDATLKFQSRPGTGNGLPTARFDQQYQSKVRQRIGRANQMFQICPMAAANDLEQARQDRKDYKRTLSEAEKTIAELEKEMTETQTEMADLKQNVDQAKIDLDEEIEQLRTETNEKQFNRLTEIANQLQQAIVKEQELDSAYYAEESKILDICQVRAQKALDERRQQRARLIQGGSRNAQRLTAANFSQMTRTSRSPQALEEFAVRVREQCMQNDVTIQRQLETARQRYEIAKKQLQLVTNQLQEQMNQVTAELKGLMQNSELQNRIRKMNRDYQKTLQEAQKKHTELTNKLRYLNQLLEKAQKEKLEAEAEYLVALAKVEQAEKAGISVAKDEITPGDFVSAAAEYLHDLSVAEGICCPDKGKDADAPSENIQNCQTISKQLDEVWTDETGSDSSKTKQRKDHSFRNTSK
jgi:hypothetical protein